MHSSVFTRAFWLLVVFSLTPPVGIDAVLRRQRVVSPNTVLFFGCALVVIAGVEVDLLPAMFGGIGVNIRSHVLIRHRFEADNRFRRKQRDA